MEKTENEAGQISLGNIQRCDFLVIGSGIAGLSFALRACEVGSVIVVTKKENYESNTNYAQGGIASVMDPGDSFDLHINDTLTCGVGLSREDSVEVLVTEGPNRVKELIDWGVRFTHSSKDPEKLSLGREGGHSRRRIVRADDLTGREVERALLEELKSRKNVSVYEDHAAVDLITRKSGSKKYGKRCIGLFVLERHTGNIRAYISRVTLLATGGCGQIYIHTTNPSIATGDGIAMAYRAGATISNMEFMQFHPTALYPDDEKAFLISEAVRGEGAILRKQNGRTFMERYHTMGCLAPRDIVARAIDREMKLSGDKYVLLDLSPIDPERIRERFPNITRECLSRGIDITKDPIPVVPSAHYICGGVVTDLDGQTSIEGLLAAGEVTSTGVHGANRLASNSLLEALVYSGRAFERAKIIVGNFDLEDIDPQSFQLGRVVTSGYDSVQVSHNREILRLTMWNYVGIVRSNARLNEAKRFLKSLDTTVRRLWDRFPLTAELVELRNMQLVARLIVECAQKRKESRGLHQNVDYPNTNDRKCKKDTIMESPY